MNTLERINAFLWHDYVLLVVLGTGLLFTVWSRFGQYRALTHGVQVIRGKYDRKDDPGAINHFQALSTALSATVGLGNIAGVAVAISIGGPGAVFWLWVTGIVGMALKMTEVTQAMLFRNTDDPQNPHGGAMWVVRNGLGRIHPGLVRFGGAVGGIFCVTLIIAAITGGNMFQAWNVADISFEYFGVPKLVTGIVLAIAVGLVIVGGIKRLGDVAGRIVPIMCALYILAGLAVIVMQIDRVPAMLALIVRCAFGPAEATGAFIGGTAGYAFLKGMQRSLFSNEAGQGSAPIAHSAAKTDQPVREGVVAGLEPFIDTLCVCTITALVVLLSGTWKREPALVFAAAPPAIEQVAPGHWQVAPVSVRLSDEVAPETSIREGQEVFLVVSASLDSETGSERLRVAGALRPGDGRTWIAEFGPLASYLRPEIQGDGAFLSYKGATLTAKAFDHALPGLGLWIVPATAWLFAFSTIISWSYYGEQGSIFLFGARSVGVYRVVYCALVLVAATPLIRTEAELDVISSLGTGIMLWANIPIMLLFGPLAMRAYHDYMRKLDRGEFAGHAYPRVADVVEGRDVE